MAFVSLGLRASPGNVLLVLAAGSRLSAYIGATVGEIGFLRGIWLDGSRRLAWLEDYAAALYEHADTPVPQRLNGGIRFDHVSFAYPGTDRVCSRISAWISGLAPLWPSSAKMAPARPRS